MFNTLNKLQRSFFDRLKENVEKRVVEEAKKKPVESEEEARKRKADREKSQIEELLNKMEKANKDEPKGDLDNNKLSRFGQNLKF
jgi:hypothetical protein